MNLTQRERATFNAALCLIHDEGHDAAAVTQDAKLRTDMGTPPKLACERAVAKFVASTPDMAAGLHLVSRLIDNSDDRTVARYNVALSSYLATGDDSGIREIAPMVAQDATDLAIRHGEALPEFSPEMEQLMAGASGPQADGVEALTADTGEDATQ